MGAKEVIANPYFAAFHELQNFAQLKICIRKPICPDI